MPLEPASRNGGNLLDLPGFLEQMRGTGDDFQFLFSAQLPVRGTVEIDYSRIVTAHNQQRRRLHVREFVERQVGATTARHHGANLRLEVGGRLDRRRRAGAGAEIADFQLARGWLLTGPLRGEETV